MKMLLRCFACWFAAALPALVLCAGCATSSPSSSSSAGFERVVPSRVQPDQLQMDTEGDYDVLYSNQPGSAVAVSLRSATADYLQFFVTTFNRGDRARPVNPGDMRLRFKGSDAQTVEMYATSNVPGQASQDARNDAQDAVELTELTRRLYVTEDVSGGEGSSAYGGDEPISEAEEVLLESSVLESGSAWRASSMPLRPPPERGSSSLRCPSATRCTSFNTRISKSPPVLPSARRPPGRHSRNARRGACGVNDVFGEGSAPG
ncbi:MAG: hypothetical protein BRD47_05860 [Bacteroidetes bacterium QS_8_68_28]|nr:MAG: hypothetical protein BRD47_05860 [Bacteroidetes bacterium QS_8_68_28]